MPSSSALEILAVIVVRRGGWLALAAFGREVLGKETHPIGVVVAQITDDAQEFARRILVTCWSTVLVVLLLVHDGV
jgi:hypothetical protein